MLAEDVFCDCHCYAAVVFAVKDEAHKPEDECCCKKGHAQPGCDPGTERMKNEDEYSGYIYGKGYCGVADCLFVDLVEFLFDEVVSCIQGSLEHRGIAAFTAARLNLKSLTATLFQYAVIN